MLRKLSTALAVLTALIHVFVGGADSLAPMLAADLPPEAAGAMHACWHFVTAMFVWSAVVFWGGGKVAFHFGMLWIAFAVVFLYVGLTQDGVPGLVTNPQWTILGITGGIAVANVLRGGQMRMRSEAEV